MADPFIAEIRAVAFGYAPRGWAECNGQLLSINQNTALFSLLGTFYGGDGRVTFGLPDLRSRVAIHMGEGPGLSNYDVGEQLGVEHETINLNELPPHSHAMQATGAAATTNDASSGIYATPNVNPRMQTLYATSANSNMGSSTITPTGGNQPHENRQPYLTCIYCIALVGIFPSRN